jgi:prepilin-type N-terminal cleavage/methylation domain-containing protein
MIVKKCSAATICTAKMCTAKICPGRNAGFSLIEVLVVVSLLGIAFSLTVPAIQTARESSRRTTCQNNLRQLSQAALHHKTQHGFYPTAGWGYQWMGDPDRGYSRRQPGGWQYNILPYIEEKTLHEQGRGLPEAAKRRVGQERAATVIALYQCPSRGRTETFELASLASFQNIDRPASAGRCDYAGNAGSQEFVIEAGLDARDLEAPDRTLDAKLQPTNVYQSGVIFARSEVRHVRDGAANTYLIGERHVSFERYERGYQTDDDQGWGVGYDTDSIRTTQMPPQFDHASTLGDNAYFGGPHLGGFHMTFCDGSLRQIAYDIDPAIHYSLGNRADGLPQIQNPQAK